MVNILKVAGQVQTEIWIFRIFIESCKIETRNTIYIECGGKPVKPIYALLLNFHLNDLDRLEP